MPNLVLDLLKYVFLAVLYIFVWRAVKAVYLELRPPTRRRPAPVRHSPSQARPPARRGRKSAARVAVIDGDNHKGKTIDLGNELTIGRAEACGLRLDDTYVSQMHARIFSKGERYVVEDLGSTNGTYLNRHRISSPTELQRGDQVKVGKTVLELRK
ncbi:MAG TPA: FHA domain-containing protein [Actinomycetota bacterium]|nr:FHA domain-containing protein [Actinomycetota bacterium]